MNKKIKKYIPKKVQNVNLEMKKPSELCQVLFFSDFNKNEYAQLTSLQIDLASTMFFLISDVMNKQKLTESDIYEWSSLNHFEIDLQTIAEMIGKYENGFYEPIVSNLQELSKVQVLTNTLHKNKAQEQTLFHLIRKISWLKEKQTSSRRVKVWIEPELLIMFHNVQQMYTQFYLQIQYGLNSKYSKLLYEVLKDYSKLGELTLDFDTLKALLNIDIENNTQNEWSGFNRDILKRAVKEVTDKSDISVTYEPIKERDDKTKKLAVSKVKFKMKRQQSILIDYEAAAEKFDIDTHVVSDDDINTRELTPIDIKYIQLAQKRMSEAKMYGTIVKNEQKYLEKVIEDLKSQDLDVENMVELDKILNEIKSKFDKDKTSKHQLLVLDGFDKYPVVTISKDYKLYSPADRANITETIEETINKINSFKNGGGKFKLIETPDLVSDMEISYL